MALADIEYPDLSEPPPLAKKNGVEYPVNEMLRKKLWLDYTILLDQQNMVEIHSAMMKHATGIVTNGQVDEVKKNSELESEESQ